jgi:hypothetical protein
MGQGCGVEVGYAHVCLGALDSGALGREPSAFAESDMINSDRNVVFERGVRLYTRLAIKLEMQRQERRVVDLKIRQQLASLYTPSYLCFTPFPQHSVDVKAYSMDGASRKVRRAYAHSRVSE